MKKIALEEHVMLPGFEEYWLPTVADIPAPIKDSILSKLSEIGDDRIAEMDQGEVAHSIVSLAGPGVQVEKDTTTAVRKAQAANDALAIAIRDRRDRLSGFAHLALQDGKASADELERSVTQLGFKGALINGTTFGLSLDDASLEPLWERAEALKTVIYLHPGDPTQTMSLIEGQKALRRAMWEWTVETGSHALRVVLGGTFDRYPGARLALGHLGETLPYLLWRFDSRAKIYGLELDRTPSEYIRDNLLVTMSGMFSRAPLVCAIEALGAENVFFSVDYPFEKTKEAAEFIESVDISESAREAICFRNAERVFGIR